MAKKEEATALSEMKYSKDGPFTDPVVRCNGCHELILTGRLKEIGMCPKCGHTRVANVRTFSDEEWDQMKKWGVDPQFLALFADVDSGTKGDNF